MAGLFSFRGRTSRLGFLKVEIAFYGLIYVAFVLLVIAGSNMHMDIPARDIPSFVPRFAVPYAVAVAMFVGGGVMMVGLIWLSLALDVRRLHDIGLSGWFVLLSILLTRIVPDPPNWPSELPGLASMIWDVAMLLIPGQAGRNKYGPGGTGMNVEEVF